jgi:DNA-binding XRE family transcriptional regulator
MSDARALKRANAVRYRLNFDLYYEVCRAKGATTQEQRAELMGISRRALSRYEVLLVEPLVSSAHTFATRLGLTVEELWVENPDASLVPAA